MLNGRVQRVTGLAKPGTIEELIFCGSLVLAAEGSYMWPQDCGHGLTGAPSG